MTKTALFSIINGILLMALVLLEYNGIISFSLPFSYNWMKIIHIFAVILFMGNMIIGPVWFFLAFYANDTKLLQFSDKLLNLTDMIFTIPGLDIAVITGLFLASAHGGSAQQPWLTRSVYMLILLWVFSQPLVFIQQKISKIIASAPENQQAIQKWLIHWSIWGKVAIGPPAYIFYMMVMKHV